MNAGLFDVAIVGAGPAGATAATFLAKKKDRVVLVDRATFPRDVTCVSWLNARGAGLLDELGVGDKTLLNRAFRDVTFYRASFAQSVKPRFKEPPGYLIDRARLGNALVTTAVDHGVTFIQGCTATDVQLKESSVVVRLAGERQVEGKLLVLASGSGSELLERAGLTVGAEESPIWTAQVDAPLRAEVGHALDTPGAMPACEAGMPRSVERAISRGESRASRTVDGPEPRVGVVLGLDAKGSFGVFCVLPDRVSVAVNWVGESSEAIPALVNLCGQAFEHKVVPLDLIEAARSAKLSRSPGAAALDMESHVGKHTLLIGDAGGFVSAASNERLWPGMWSAQIAAGVADKALHSTHSQDELMTFDSMWRMQMADYLRSPHTDIQFLLPLIFSNRPMADRMGAAFFSGENI